MSAFHDNLLREGFTTAYLDRTYPSNLAYKPQFISNNYKEGRKVLSSIEDELLSCEEFFISVAFITMGGITPLLQTLKELERRGIPGKILTTDYQNFSEPRALRKLAGLNNITLKMYRTDEAQEGFHTKGYIFKNEELYRIIVGSSNLTLSAQFESDFKCADEEPGMEYQGGFYRSGRVCCGFDDRIYRSVEFGVCSCI